METYRLESAPFLSASGFVAMARRAPTFDKPLTWAARRFLSECYAAEPEAPVGPILDRACDVRQNIRVRLFKAIRSRAGGAYMLATAWPTVPVWVLLALLDGRYTVETETDTVVVLPPVAHPG